MQYLPKLQKPSETARKQYINWLSLSRPKQISPSGDWNVWLILAGRGWGKTRTGSQDIVHYALTNGNTRCAVVAPTFSCPSFQKIATINNQEAEGIINQL